MTVFGICLLCLFLACCKKQGIYINKIMCIYTYAMKALGSHGCASHDDADALQELQSRHPQHALSQWSDDIPSY